MDIHVQGPQITIAAEKIELANTFHALFQIVAEVYAHYDFLKALQTIETDILCEY